MFQDTHWTLRAKSLECPTLCDPVGRSWETHIGQYRVLYVDDASPMLAGGHRIQYKVNVPSKVVTHVLAGTEQRVGGLIPIPERPRTENFCVFLELSI